MSTEYPKNFKERYKCDINDVVWTKKGANVITLHQLAQVLLKK